MLNIELILPTAYIIFIFDNIKYFLLSNFKKNNLKLSRKIRRNFRIMNLYLKPKLLKQIFKYFTNIFLFLIILTTYIMYIYILYHCFNLNSQVYNLHNIHYWIQKLTGKIVKIIIQYRSIYRFLIHSFENPLSWNRKYVPDHHNI